MVTAVEKKGRSSPGRMRYAPTGARMRGDDGPVTGYARSVVDGEVVVGVWVRRAAARHLSDMARGHERGLSFDQAAAMDAVSFFGLLPQTQGEWAGQPLDLQPWQQFIVGSLFGWKRADGLRRFRTAYLEVARKNGKTSMGAALGLYLAFYDGEPGAQVYAAAMTRDQANLVWGQAAMMVRKSPGLSKRVNVVDHRSNLHDMETLSRFEALGKDADSVNGLNIHGIIFDELHAQADRGLWDVLQTARGARRQPLTVAITTAGYDRRTLCWEQHDYALKVAGGVVEDDSYFAYVAAINEGEDWRDEGVWVKANPNLGVSLKVEYLREMCKRAVEIPGEQNAFRRLHCNEWTEQSTRAIDMAVWDEGGAPFDAEALRGRVCYAGLDLARVHDVSALALVFPPVTEGEPVKVLCRFWAPAEDIVTRSRRDRAPYQLWRDAGLIVATPGNATDFAFIEHEILELAGQYDVREVAYDRVFAGEIVNGLMDEGLTMVPFGQGFLSMGAPTAELHRLLLARRLQHGGNPVLRWMASNLVERQDPAGNLKPDKERSSERVDGIVALVMALGRAAVHGGQGGWDGAPLLSV